MGEVYRARDTRLSRDVAIKVLPSELSSDEDRLQRLEKEARAASCSRIRTSSRSTRSRGSTRPPSFIAMELFAGKTLWKEVPPVDPRTGGGIGTVLFSADGKICVYTHYRFSVELMLVEGLR